MPRVTQNNNNNNRTAEGEKQAEGKKTCWPEGEKQAEGKKTCWLDESGTEVKRVKNTTLQTKHKDSKENALSPFWVQGSVSGRIYWPGGHLNSGRKNGVKWQFKHKMGPYKTHGWMWAQKAIQTAVKKCLPQIKQTSQ